MAEIIDDLQYNGLVIIRDTEGFSYGHDAVLLANFVKLRAGERLFDLGTGTGILAILISAKTGADVVACDIGERCCELARKSVEFNGQSEHIDILQADIRSLGVNEVGVFDAVVCNPPYYRAGTESANEERRRSTFEETCTLSDAVGCAGRILKNGGKLFMCYPADRLAPLCAALEADELPPKRIRFIRSKADKPPYLVLIEAKKRARDGAIIEETILEDRYD